MGSVSLPVGDGSRHEKKKDMKTETSFRFHILLLFLSPMHSIGGGKTRTLGASNYVYPYSKFSEGAWGNALRKRVPPNKLSV